MPGVDHRVVVNHDNTVPGRVHIELDAVGAQLDRALERSERVFRVRLVSAAVRNSFGRSTPSACGQGVLGVVALC